MQLITEKGLLSYRPTAFLKSILFLFTFLFSFILSSAQEPTPSPTPPTDVIKISTEEIQLNVSAQTPDGKVFPRLTADDLLIVDQGDPQTITNVRKSPASVLLLLDTGSEMNFVKKVSVTRLLAKLFLYNLSTENAVSVLQFYDKIETVADWTNDMNSVADRLDTKLFSGKRSSFSTALIESIKAFGSRSAENRHIVLITDGLDSIAQKNYREKALQAVRAANITVHILSYTALEAETARQALKRVRLGDGKTKPRAPEEVIEAIVSSIPNSPPNSKINMRETVRQMYKAQSILIWDIDQKRRKIIKNNEKAWIAAEKELQELAEETGGVYQAPEEPITLFKLALEAAQTINATYVVSYSPTKPVSESGNIQTRKVRVSTHCDGILIRSRLNLTITKTTLD